MQILLWGLLKTPEGLEPRWWLECLGPRWRMKATLKATCTSRPSRVQTRVTQSKRTCAKQLKRSAASVRRGHHVEAPPATAHMGKGRSEAPSARLGVPVAGGKAVQKDRACGGRKRRLAKTCPGARFAGEIGQQRTADARNPAVKKKTC